MLRSDYKYSREPSAESAVVEKVREEFCLGKDLASGGGKRGGSMKQWSPLAALGKRAREGLRRCNTVRSGLGLGGSGGGSSSTDSAVGGSDTASVNESVSERGRRNAMPNIFLGLPSSGVRRLFAVYGIDDTRSSGGGGFRTAKSASSASGSHGAEESLFARHTRTSSMRSRPTGFTGGASSMQYQQLLMQQQQQQQNLLQPNYYQGQLDRRRASSMRDHSRQHRPVSSSGNR